MLPLKEAVIVHHIATDEPVKEMEGMDLTRWKTRIVYPGAWNNCPMQFAFVMVISQDISGLALLLMLIYRTYNLIPFEINGWLP